MKVVDYVFIVRRIQVFYRSKRIVPVAAHKNFGCRRKFADALNAVACDVVPFSAVRFVCYFVQKLKADFVFVPSKIWAKREAKLSQSL